MMGKQGGGGGPPPPPGKNPVEKGGGRGEILWLFLVPRVPVGGAPGSWFLLSVTKLVDLRI